MQERFIGIHGRLDFKLVDGFDDGIFADFEGMAVPYHQVTLGSVSNVETIEEMIEALRMAKPFARVDWPGLDETEAAEAAERELESDIRYLEQLEEAGYEVETVVDEGLAKWVLLTGGPVCNECERRLGFQEENGEWETVCRTCEPPEPPQLG